ncbi:MAG TPA: hypothetical protein VNE40_03520 [Candidatus Dormibacteraeota bacterium]|nr:hypothetical protein [Candidatus Dormibacteraeota bacterium]
MSQEDNSANKEQTLPKQKDKPQSLTMQVKVYSPSKVYFDEPAQSISAVNRTGPFDILSRHHNFITLLNPCELLINQGSGLGQRIRISGGIMHVKADKITVFLDV